MCGGIGNFSFAHSLLDHPSIPSLPPTSITATAYDTEPECLSKYPDAASHISALRSAGATVLFGIDARHLDKTVAKGDKRWDKVVWNFPHVGMGIADRERNVVANQRVLVGFLKSVAGVLEEGAVPDPSGKKKGKGRRKVDEVEFSEEEEERGLGDSLRRGGEKRAGSVLVTLREQEPYTLW
jgi:25S rRNA (uracil2634-N3)-methyltransferase